MNTLYSSLELVSSHRPFYLESHRKFAIFYRKWKEIQKESLKIINHLLGIGSKISLCQNKEIYGDLLEFKQISERSSSRLLESLSNTIPELNTFLEKFDKMINEMRNFQRDFEKRSLWILQRGSLSMEIYEQVESNIREYIQMFETDFHLRKRIVAGISNHPFKPARFSLLLTLWALEPYIEYERIQEILEESLHLERAYERLQTEEQTARVESHV